MTSNYEEMTRHNERMLGEDRKSRMSQVALYADSAHFIYELLQNTDDAKATEAMFRLESDRLVLEHNGVAFNQGNVRSISYFHDSTKDHTQIGRFGLGFKSVFSYTTTPRIHSGEESFELYNLYSLRTWQDPQPLKLGCTRIELPFNVSDDKPAYLERHRTAAECFSDIASKLKSIGAQTLLFTQHLRSIEWSIQGAENVSGTYLSELQPVSACARQVQLLAEAGSKREELHYLIFERVIEWQTKPMRPAQLAFKLDKEWERGGRIVRQEQSRLSVYFPTGVETHLGFIPQGPYRTTPARDNVVLDEPFNRHLAEQTGLLLGEALRSLRDENRLTLEVIDALPLQREHFAKGTLFCTLHEEVRSLLNEEALLPVQGGGYVSGKNAVLARGRELPELFDAGNVFGRAEMRWLDTEITQDKRPGLRGFLLGEKRNQWASDWLVKPIISGGEKTFADIVSKLTAELLKAQSETWLLRLYEALNALTSPSQFANAPLVRLESGEHVQPKPEQVFLPSEHPTELPSAKRSLFANPTAKGLFDKWGLREPDLVDHVITRVLSRYKQAAALGDVEQYQQHLNLISAALNTDSASSKARLLQSLQTHHWLLAENGADSACLQLRSPKEVYARSDENRAWFSGNSAAWLAAPNHVSDFSITLGLSSLPRVSRQRRQQFDLTVTISFGHGWHKRGLAGFDPDWQIDGLDHALACIDSQRSAILWKLALESPSCIKGIVESSSRQDYSHSTKKEQLSEVGKKLLDSAWLQHRDGHFSAPCNLLLNDLSSAYDRESVAAHTLSEKLGMKKPELEQAIKTVSNGDPILEKLLSLHQQGKLDDKKRAEIEKIIRSDQPPEPPIPFAEALSERTKLQRPSSPEPNAPTASGVTNPSRYQGKLDEEARQAKEHQATTPRASNFTVIKASSANQQQRADLRQWYEGHCQISGETFLQSNGENYFEAVCLVSRNDQEWLNNVGNMLCLSADSAARLKHGAFEWIDDLEEKIQSFVPEKEGGNAGHCTIRIRLCEQNSSIIYCERHFLSLRALFLSM